MKASNLKASFILLLVVLSLGFILIGYKKETLQTYELTAKEKEFLSAPNAVTCKLEEIKISKIDIPKNKAPSIIDYMERHNRRYVKQAPITLANRPFKIILGFFPEREFYVYDIEKGFIIPNSWTSYNLHSYHKIDNELFEFMLIEGDTKIAARPYQGPLGTIKLGKGGRQLEKIGFRGSLFMKAGISAPIGTMQGNWPGPVEQCRIPVGDYTPGLLSGLHVTYDNLLIRISNYSNARGRYSENDIIYPIQIRQDKPYVLDFSNEPMVIFNHSHRSQTTFSRGDEIRFTTSLIDPKLDIRIDSLHDRAVKVNREYIAGGKLTRTKVTKSLDPIIVITHADGEIIAEDVFSSYRYTSWRVPDDLEINGDAEEFTVTVTYETQKLYGRVSAKQKIIIRK
ncbi:MAG TPA: hypothetical protein DIU00_10750 [Phycisphaerales bacterium]|nr:hypothetical protein [Phycisphaerales bacterium]